MVPGNFKLTPDDSEFPVLFDHGKVAAIYFWLAGGTAQSLHVAVYATGGALMQETDVMVGAKPGTVGVTFKTKASANAVVITPGGHGPSDRRIAFCLV